MELTLEHGFSQNFHLELATSRGRDGSAVFAHSVLHVHVTKYLICLSMNRSRLLISFQLSQDDAYLFTALGGGRPSFIQNALRQIFGQTQQKLLADEGKELPIVVAFSQIARKETSNE
jgi:hypothetical protein